MADLLVTHVLGGCQSPFVRCLTPAIKECSRDTCQRRLCGEHAYRREGYLNSYDCGFHAGPGPKYVRRRMG